MQILFSQRTSLFPSSYMASCVFVLLLSHQEVKKICVMVEKLWLPIEKQTASARYLLLVPIILHITITLDWSMHAYAIAC